MNQLADLKIRAGVPSGPGAEPFVTSFIEPVWADLESVVEDGSKCVAVLGARGSGKTTLLRHAVSRVDNQGDVAVYFSSPCAYSSSAFLSSLCHALAQKTETKLVPRSSTLADVLNRRRVQLGIAATVTGTAVLILKSFRIEQRLVGLLLLIVGLAWAVIAAAWGLRQRQLTKDPRRRLYLHAAAMRRWTQYSSVMKSANEWALEAGQGIVVKGKASEELALSERPVTELGLVTEFKSLVRELGDEGIRVLIAIDGLDKVDSADEVRKLLRRIKAIFDAGAIVLVTVGDEAVLHLGRPDEIRSSFAKVYRVPSLRKAEVRRLTAKLGGADCSDMLWVLTGGNLREFWELYQHVRRTRPAKLTPPGCIDKATELEKRNFEQALVLDPDVGERQRSSAFVWARDHLFSNAQSIQEKALSLRVGWTPEWADADATLWPSIVAKHWRSLLVRDVLRSVLREGVVRQAIGDESLGTLKEAFRLSWHSAGIALQTASADKGVQAILNTPVVAAAPESTVTPPIAS